MVGHYEVVLDALYKYIALGLCYVIRSGAYTVIESNQLPLWYQKLKKHRGNNT